MAPSSAKRSLVPVGFLLLMFGFGLRLDTSWQGVGWALLAAGATAVGAGLLRRAFVPSGVGE
jgi:hypothetical protein